MRFKLVIIFLLHSFTTYSQLKYETVDTTSFAGTVIAYAPRIGYSYINSHVAEIGYGIYIGREDQTIDDNKKLFLENIKKVSHSLNIGLEYTKIHGHQVWTPKISYVTNFFLLAARGDLLWQTNNFRQGYFGSRVGLGVGIYNIGLFAIKEVSLGNRNPFRQNWGISFSTFIWGGKQKYIRKTSGK